MTRTGDISVCMFTVLGGSLDEMWPRDGAQRTSTDGPDTQTDIKKMS